MSAHINFEEAEKLVGVGPKAVKNWVRWGYVDTKVVNDEVRLIVRQLDEIRILRESYPRGWYPHCSWFVDKPVEPVQDIEPDDDPDHVDEVDTSVDVDTDMLKDTVALAGKFKSTGNLEKACELYEFALEYVDFDSIGT